MNFRILPPLHLLVALSALVVALPAQRGGDEEIARRKQQAEAGELTEAGAPDDDRARREKEEWASLTPEQRLERRTRRGASAHCQFVASCRPAKLLPGQSGTMVVAALLKGNVVMPSPAPVELLRLTSNAPIELGPLTVRPAELGVDAAAYRGQPVYENYAWFEIPVRMLGDAKIGDKHQLSVDLKFDLFDGGSAMPVGRFIELVATEVEVGVAVDPRVEGRKAATAKPEVPVSAGTGDGKTAAAESGTVPEGSSSAVEAAPPVEVPPVDEPEAVREQQGSGGAPAVAGVDGLPTPLLIGGGVLVLAVVLLFTLRRK